MADHAPGTHKRKAIFNWSGGKDSALCLYEVLAQGDTDVSYLLTSINEQYQRISMHGVRIELLDQQAASIGIPLVKMLVPEMPDMAIYDALMASTLSGLKSQGMEVCIFGDIFLEDLRQYREGKLAEVGLQASFPLWKRPTDQLIREFIDLGFKAVIVCVNDRYLDRSFAGRVIDDSLIRDLPDNVDPCGENGEFHSFVYDGPIFNMPVNFMVGEIVYRKYSPPQTADASQHERDSSSPDPFDDGFWYCDLLPTAEPAGASR
jgi:uncharacterized protein (TIGR00290 family)